MCGIFGIIQGHESRMGAALTERTMQTLFRLSESRGKEASGIAVITPETIYVAKSALPASRFIHLKSHRDLYQHLNHTNTQHAVGMMGHSRLVTNGGHQIHQNNQPVLAEGIVGIHNGIITNVDDLWQKFPMLEKQTDIDTEVFLKLIRKFYQESANLITAVQRAYACIEGVASVALMFADLDSVILGTNNGSLYWSRDEDRQTILFASERYILNQLLSQSELQPYFKPSNIWHIAPGEGLVFGLDNLSETSFLLDSARYQPGMNTIHESGHKRQIVDVSAPSQTEHQYTRIPGEGPYVLAPSFVDAFPRNQEAVAQLRRCTRCVLPETMPFVEFDEDGVCNYCREYTPIKFAGIDALREAVEPYRSKNGEPDCLLTLSGGRDSSYTAHIMRTELGMNPVTYTYDWGMVTDLARRNQMRVCGKLGLENILVSANLARKRGNIRRNVTAWLKQPDLGMVPLFMAGDKQYFYYANKVARQVGVKLVILGENLLETTRFKTGFCGIPPQHGSQHTYSLTLANKVQLAGYYLQHYLTNPAYLNRSLLDTAGAYISYYFIPHNYLNVYEYVRWEEEAINHFLIDEYNWETAPDTTTTWRIGDGTAAFYNYIYYTLAGLTEIDTFRSNQIREGMLTRDEALRLIQQENQPRYESMQWYCDIIGIDFYDAIRTINALPKRYAV